MRWDAARTSAGRPENVAKTEPVGKARGTGPSAVPRAVAAGFPGGRPSGRLGHDR